MDDFLFRHGKAPKGRLRVEHMEFKFLVLQEKVIDVGKSLKITFAFIFILFRLKYLCLIFREFSYVINHIP